MIVALYILGALVGVGLLLKLTDRDKGGASDSPDDIGETPEVCCGLHAVCERTGTASMADEIEYFDDEELDVYAGREADGYSDEETEQFRDVMLTLPAGEAALWAKSLERRGITLPSILRDELMMLVEG